MGINVEQETVYALGDSLGAALGMAMKIIHAHPPTSARNIGRAAADLEKLADEFRQKNLPLNAAVIGGVILGLQTRPGDVPTE